MVKWADTEKERQARRAQKALSLASNVPNADSRHHPSLFGALPMGYMPPYNGYGYQVREFLHMGYILVHAKPIRELSLFAMSCFLSWGCV